MNTQVEQKILDVSGKLILESGVEDFTLAKLSAHPLLEAVDKPLAFGKEEEVFTLLMYQLEKALKFLLEGMDVANLSPAAELEMLFKNLHRLFENKPYYLILIFDKDFRRRFRAADNILARIKQLAEGHLTALIERGKEAEVFRTDIKTKILVTEILTSFQAMMGNVQLADKMVRNIKKYQSETD